MTSGRTPAAAPPATPVLDARGEHAELLQDIGRPGNHQFKNHEVAGRLHRHGKFGPARQCVPRDFRRGLRT
jgi:hypothetical protein